MFFKYFLYQYLSYLNLAYNFFLTQLFQFIYLAKDLFNKLDLFSTSKKKINFFKFFNLFKKYL
jgi:hypothetical protein